jgi:V8-like Glu-specific endopeptidase
MESATYFTSLIGRTENRNVSFLGTCIVLTTNIVATAAHVIGSNYKNLCVIQQRILNIDEYQDTTNHHYSCHPAKLTHVDNCSDIAILEFEALPPPFHLSPNFPPLRTLDDITVGENLVMYGFPHCVDGRSVLTEQHTRLGAKILLGSDRAKYKHGIINIQTRPGQSGSPVLSNEGKIIGMLVGTYRPKDNPYAFQGIAVGGLNQTSQIVSAEYIQDML